LLIKKISRKPVESIICIFFHPAESVSLAAGGVGDSFLPLVQDISTKKGIEMISSFFFNLQILVINGIWN
jgi:hypothetical protein